MPTDRVLIEIVTAANLAGVEAAKTSFLGMNAATLGLAASLGVLVLAGKSAIENTEAMNKAHLSLQQATAADKLNFDALQASFDTWAETNKRYIPDQYAAEIALAAFVRAGANAKEAMRELNDALDLSTARGEDMATAQQQITLALAGNSRGLKALGITTDEYNAIMKDKLLTTEQKHAALLALIETKTKDGRKVTTDLSQSTNALNKDWQDISTKVGPPLLGLLSALAGGADWLITKLNDLGNNKDWNRWLSKGFGDLQNQVIAFVKWVESLIEDIKWLQGHPVPGQAPGYTGGAGVSRGRAAGGPVAAGQTYLVGERGPEMLTMGASGGYVTPNGGGSPTINVHIYGSVLSGHDLDRFFNEGLRRARFAPGT